MTARLKARNNPSLMVMSCDPGRARVTDMIVVPRHFFTADLIEPRRPLGPNARRAGWQGCNILIGRRAAYRSRRGSSLLEACPRPAASR